ncbi:hypothetical protein ACMZ6Y_05700 [Streptococcus pluranimalium]
MVSPESRFLHVIVSVPDFYLTREEYKSKFPGRTKYTKNESQVQLYKYKVGSDEVLYCPLSQNDDNDTIRDYCTAEIKEILKFKGDPLNDSVSHLKQVYLRYVVDGFLIQYLTINKKMLSQLELLDKSYSWESEDGSISYQLQDHSLNHFLQEENNKKAKIIIGIHYETIHENKFQYGMRIKYDNNIKYTFGFSGYETIGKENEE